MAYSPVVKHESKSTPGAVFVLRRLTEGLRSKLEDATWEDQQARAKLDREIVELRAAPDLKPLADQMSAILKNTPAITSFKNIDELSEADRAALEKFTALTSDPKWDQVRALGIRHESIERNSINHTYFEKTLVRIEGCELEDEDGKAIPKPTARQWIDLGPNELYAEILAEIRIAIGLDPKEIKNSESPSTLNVPVDGPMTTTIAEPVAA